MSTTKKVLIKDIAEAVCCSPSTVSIVLADKGDRYRVSQSKQQEIISVAREMGYIFSKSGGSEQDKDTLIIAIFICFDDHMPLRSMFHGMSEFPAFGGKRLDFSMHPYQPDALWKYESIFTDKRYDGVIFVPSTETDVEFLEKSDYDFPCVIMGRIVKKYCSVIINRYEPGEVAAKIFLAKGFKRVAILRKSGSKSGMLRTFAFVSTYKESNDADSGIMITEAEIGKDALFAVNKLLSAKGDLPEAVFIADPNRLSGVLRSVHDNNITLPDDLELLAFGDYEDNSLSESLYPSISSVGPPIKQMMMDSIDLLCKQIKGPSLCGMIRELPIEVRFRDSCPKPDSWNL